ncbi:MAG: hypothetical protein KKB50_13565 [Planctomycetes bacterium]|nr:hypothetical protein [Planctomycetota bacterium]
MSRRGRYVASAAVFACLLGCRARDEPATTPTSRPASAPTSQDAASAAPATDPLLPESYEWSNAEARAALADPDKGLSAAVRLVRLHDATPLCVPDPLTAAMATRLRVLRVPPEQWALGYSESSNERCLHSPILVEADGTVTALAAGVDEELLRLYVSEDPDIFPHLLIWPQRVGILNAPEETALALTPPAEDAEALCPHFELRLEDGYACVVLALAGEAGPVDVARYAWDPYELSFLGPAANKLPEPFVGRFDLDMEASTALQPVGGEIPKPVQPKEPDEKEEELPPY